MRQYTRIAQGDRPLRTAILGWSAFVVALASAGLGVAVIEAVLAEPPGALLKVVPAVITLAIAVPLVLLLHRRHRGPLALAHPGRFVTGAAVTVGAAVVVLAPAFLAGWITVTEVDLAVLLLFLASNTMLALALEALPEELAFRGSVYGSLRARMRPSAAGGVTTVGFVLAPAGSIALAAGLGAALGLPTPAASFAPGGQDPVAYAVLLAGFGAVLILAREATGSIWAAVGVHLAFLTINRIFFSSGNFETGLVVEAEPGAELLVLVYLMVAAAVFVVGRPLDERWRRRAG